MPRFARLAAPALALAPAFALAGCLSFGESPPESLLALSSVSAPAAGAAQTTATGTVAISTPNVPQELAVARVPVRATDTSIAYVKDARWVEPPARLFARLLGDTVVARTGRVVTGSRTFGEAGAILSGDLRNFGVDAASGTAVVTYDALLERAPGRPGERRRFEARVPVSPVEAAPVGAALNQAANTVATEVADWLGRQ